MNEGELKKRIETHLSWLNVNRANSDMISAYRIYQILDEAIKELLENPQLHNYEEIAVPEAWEPWLKKWFGVEVQLRNEEK